jgi:hypothetical protein
MDEACIIEHRLDALQGFSMIFLHGSRRGIAKTFPIAGQYRLQLYGPLTSRFRLPLCLFCQLLCFRWHGAVPARRPLGELAEHTPQRRPAQPFSGRRVRQRNMRALGRNRAGIGTEAAYHCDPQR